MEAYRQADPTHIELKTYLDGALVETRLFSGNLENTDNDVPLAIASARGGVEGGAFRGIIDEISLYNRVLSGEEVRAIYNAGSLGKCLLPQENSAPSARIVLSPRLEIQGAPHALVVACDGAGANIVLDGLGSTDPDGDPLSFTWFAGGALPFSREPVVHTMADVGLHTVMLRVSDGQSSANTSLTFEVITPGEAAAQISLLLEAVDVSRKAKAPLQAALNGAIQALEKGKLESAIGQLHAFDNKVKAQLPQENAALAEQLSAATEALIRVLDDCPKHPEHEGDENGGN